jgi:alpha-tubulin suppressor-like RCC1 family protein
VPVAAQSGVVAIAAGGAHTVALKSDGSVLAWGRHNEGQTNVPIAAQSGVTAIAAGELRTVALKNDGSVLAWGEENHVPVTAQSGVTAIAAGWYHSAALKNDGSVLTWGGNLYGQTTVPAGAQNGVTATAAGWWHTVALKNDGSVVAWGAGTNNTGLNPNYGQSLVPVAAQNGVTAIAAGALHTVALIGTVPLRPSLNARPSGNELILFWSTNAVGFTLQSTFSLNPPVTWVDVTHPPAVLGAQWTITNAFSGSAQFYRLRKL